MFSTQKTTRIFAVESTGLRVRAAIFSRANDGTLICEAQESARGHDPITALPEIAGRLRERGVSIPRTAILLTSETVGAVLELPIDPAKPLPRARMHETVRWELEPFISDQAMRLRLGSLLVGRGYVSVEQLHGLLSEHENAKAVGITGLTRLGDTAIEQKAITAAQLKECLDLQQHLANRGSGELVCGWHALCGSAEHLWKWQVCALPKGRRDALVELFAGQGLRLERIFPLIGPSASLCSGDESCTLLDVHEGIVGCLRMAKGSVHSLRTHAVTCPLALGSTCEELLDDEPGTLKLTGSVASERLSALAEDLTIRTGLNCAVLHPHSSPNALPPEWTALQGAAHGAFALDAACAAHVPASDPPRPLQERSQFWTAAAVVAALFVAGGIEFIARGKRAELTQIEAENSRVQAAIERRSNTQNELEAKRKSLETLRGKIDGADTAVRFLSDELPRRESLLPDFLNAVRHSVNDDLILYRLAESEDGSIAVRGWSLTETGVQDFKLALGDHLRNLALDSAGLNVRMEKSDEGVDGYVFEFHLLPNSSKVAQSNPQGGVQ